MGLPHEPDQFAFEGASWARVPALSGMNVVLETTARYSLELSAYLHRIRFDAKAGEPTSPRLKLPRRRPMRPQLNHSIVWCRDKIKSAGFFNPVIGLPPTRPVIHFLIVDLLNSFSFDQIEAQ